MPKYTFNAEILITENHQFLIKARDESEASEFANKYCTDYLNAREVVICSIQKEKQND